MDTALEEYLWNEISYADEEKRYVQKRFPRDVINEMVKNGWIKSPKQAWETLEKWLRKDKYDYGSCLDLGWKKNP